MTQPTFATRLIQAIEASGLTRAEVARRADMAPQQLNHYLAGNRDPARAASRLRDSITRLAAAIGCTVEELGGE